MTCPSCGTDDHERNGWPEACELKPDGLFPARVDADLLAAQREVDAATPGSPPIADVR